MSKDKDQEMDKRGIEDFSKTLISELNKNNYNYDLSLDNVYIKEPIIDIKEAKLGNKSYIYKLYGDLSITDRKAKESRQYKNMHIFDLPKKTDFGTFIVKGVEYNTVKQLRKIPGVYYRMSAGTPLALFNTGRKSNFKISYNPDTLVFKLYYNGNLPLYPILIYLGYKDSELSSVWGEDILAANQTSVRPMDAANRLYSNMFYGKSVESDSLLREGILTQFEESTLDMKEVRSFLDVESGNVTPEVIVAATQKLIDLAADKIDEHDGNDIYSSRIVDYQDYISEKIGKVGDPRIFTRWLRKVYDGKIGLYGVIQRPIDSTFTTFEMSNVFNQTNPMAMLASESEVTKMGPGAIGQKEAVTLADSDLRANYAGILDPAKTPESHKVGVSLYLTRNATLTHDDIQIKLYDVRLKKEVPVTNKQLSHKVVAFPQEYTKRIDKDSITFIPKRGKVQAYKDGEMVEVLSNRVDYIIMNSEDMFNYTSLSVPFLNTDQGNRLLMASKHVVQALPLKHNEAPKIQVDYTNIHNENKLTLEQLLAQMVADGRELSPCNGEVISVTAQYVTIKDNKGDKRKISIYKDYPLNGNVYFTETPIVKVGDKVKAGQRILTNNFLRDNTLALGTNLNVAYIPYKGYNYEDGIIISEEAAKKLTSTHMYVLEHAFMPDITGEKSFANKRKYIAAYPEKYNAAQLNNIDDDGVIKPGTSVNVGDPLMLALRKATATYEERLFKVSRKILKNKYVDLSMEWEHDFKGVITDIVRTHNRVKITIKTEEPAQLGDKLTGRHGNKGIITKIISSSEMPKDKDGNVPEVLLSPLGIVSRINPGQLYETVAGKVADATGKVIKIKPFGENRYEEVKTLAKKHNVDPNTEMKYSDQEKYKKVLAGPQYMYKLDQSIVHKISGVGETQPYSKLSGQPIKTNYGNPQSLDHLTLYALLSHGAKANIREAATYKSDIGNKDYWQALELGLPLPRPQRPVSLNKFLDMLKGAGIDAQEYGNTFELQPLTDRRIKEIAKKKVPDPSKMLKAKNLEPVKGGLYDIDITGGIDGDKWSRIELPETIPNPVFANAIKAILKDRYGLKESDYNKIIEGKLYINSETLKITEQTSISKVPAEGEKVEKKFLTGSKAFEKLLDINIDKYEEKLLQDIKKSRSKVQTNNKYKALKYIGALRRTGYTPKEAYMIKNVPVIPPTLRPVYVGVKGNVMIPDVNHLYKDLGLLIKSTKDIKNMPDSVRKKLNSDIYKATAAIEGWGDPITNKNLKGILTTIVGSAPKRGFFQSKVVSRRQLTSGRSTITPGPELGIDEVGLPVEMGWDIFRPYILKDLIAKGYTPIEALEKWKKKDPTAYKAMERVVANRPVLLNRAPSLHKWSIMAFKPKLITGKAIRVNQLVVKPFNLDFDGDAMSVHVPSTSEAVQEAFTLMPSKNIIKYGQNTLFIMPQTEIMLGIYEMSKIEGKSKSKYSSGAEALLAYKKGQLGLNEKTSISGVKTALGNYLLNEALPYKYRQYNTEWDGAYLREVLYRIYRKEPNNVYTRVVNKVKELGNKYGTELMPSVQYKDLKPDKKLQTLFRSKKSASEIERKLSKSKNTFAIYPTKGIRGRMNQVRQILVAPGRAVSIRGKTYKNIDNSYSEGLTPSQYYKAMFGARQGAINKNKMTQEPGAFNKQLAANYSPLVITREESDDPGISLSINDPTITSRYLAETLKKKGKVVAKRGIQITPKLKTDIKKRGYKQVKVMSPLSDTTPNGIAAKSFGLMPDGHLPEIGTNIGIISTHTITEPLSQSTLSAFHTGGIKSGETGLARVWSLFKNVRRPEDAVLTQASGKISKIDKLEKGGYKIYVEDDPYICPATNTPIVKVNQIVERGDALTNGNINQKDLMELKGEKAVKRYMLRNLKEAIGPSYKDDRFLEVLIRGATDKCEIVDPGHNLWLDKGDLTSVSYIDSVNRDKKAEIPVAYAEGSVLAEKLKGAVVHKGKSINKKDIVKLKNANIDRVTIETTPIKYKRVIISTEYYPAKQPDWMEGMNYSYLSNILRQGVSRGAIADLNRPNPISRYALGRLLVGEDE